MRDVKNMGGIRYSDTRYSDTRYSDNHYSDNQGGWNMQEYMESDREGGREEGKWGEGRGQKMEEEDSRGAWGGQPLFRQSRRMKYVKVVESDGKGGWEKANEVKEKEQMEEEEE